MKIYLANPRGFCAGVDRAIDIVDLSLKKYGAPIYVRHEIVHSRHVVNTLRRKGAVFVEELNEVPEGSVVIVSAHGVAKSVWEEANQRRLHVIDATCPLVIKVHNEVNRDYTQGYELILIGHAGHPEVIGTLGQVPDKFHLVSSVEDVEKLKVDNTVNLSYVTQTTLSVDECRDIVGALHQRFPIQRAPSRGYLLRHAEPAECRQRVVASRGCHSGDRVSEQFQFEPVAGIGRAVRHPLLPYRLGCRYRSCLA